MLLAGWPLTTPALHWSVQQLNDPRNNGATLAELADRHLLSMREAHARLFPAIDAAKVLAVRVPRNCSKHQSQHCGPNTAKLQAGHETGLKRLCIDCANGVGALALRQMALPWQLYNTGEGGLNDQCGADYVQKERAVPAGCSSIPESALCAKQICITPRSHSWFAHGHTRRAQNLWHPLQMCEH